MAGANSNIQLTGLDFDEIKQNLKTFLRSQDVLKDINYEGSVISVLLDILAYNTHYNAHYLNMVANEMFLDTAVKRSSVVSKAKALGYTPQSFSAPTAIISIQFSGVTAEQIVLPKYTKFLTETLDGINYPYVTLEEYVLKANTEDNTATATEIEIKQGEPSNYSFTYTDSINTSSKFKIPDSNVDLSTLKVVVQNSSIDINSEVYAYANDILALDGNSKVYFIQETYDGYYELYFGDGILGKKLIDGNIVSISYLSVSPTIVHNVSNFSLVSDTIGNYLSVLIRTTVPSSGGRYKESISSIKFIAPKAYAAQERAVTVNDYIALIQKNSGEFPIDSVNVWSGEENSVPVYGKIFVSVKPKGGFTVTANQKKKIEEDIIKPISVMTVQPVVIDVDYTFVNVQNTVLYDKTRTTLGQEELRTIIIGAIRSFGNDKLNKFNSTLILPELTNYVNQANPSVITNESIIYLEKRFTPTFGAQQTYTFDYGVQIKRDFYRNSLKLSPTFQIYDPVANLTRTEMFVEEVPTSATSIQSIQITNPGYKYTSVPTVSIIGDGTGATAYAVITNGQIEKIIITDSGINYTQASVVISGGGGYLGSAKAILQKQYGDLRSYYFSKGKKVIFNKNVGNVDYINGIVTLTDFSPINVNNTTGSLSVYIVPDTSIIYSKQNKMVVMDQADVNAIKVNLVTK